MKLKDIIQLLEDVVFEMMSWIVFFPITMFRVVKPKWKWAFTYVTEAHEEADPKKRYLDGLSPVLFYFISIVLTVVIEKQSNLSFDVLENLSQTNLLVAAIGAFSVPFISAFPFWLLISWQPKWSFNFDRNDLRRLFEIQCMVWPVLYLIVALLSLYLQLFGISEGGLSLTIVLVLMMISTVYFMVILFASVIRPIIDQTSLSSNWKGIFGFASLGWFYLIVQYILPLDFVFSGLYQLFTSP
jgi:hypothetical protein